jgi:hypothetical protein
VIKGLNNPLDPTWSANNGVYTLPANVPIWIAGGGTNPWPNWAKTATGTSWGLSSYSANFQVFGDKGITFTGIMDGLSHTTIFGERYAVASRATGTPTEGAGLWAYGTPPVVTSYDHAANPLTALATSTYSSSYWSRFGYVNLSGPSAGWTTNPALQTQNWNCQCHMAPEFNKTATTSHPLKLHGMVVPSIWQWQMVVLLPLIRISPVKISTSLKPRKVAICLPIHKFLDSLL